MVRATTTALAVAFAFLSVVAGCRNDLPTEPTPPQVRRDIPPPTDQAPYYLYQGQPVPLTIDPTALAVYGVAADAPTVARGLLQSLGIRVEASHALPQGDQDWTLALPASTSVEDALAARDRLRQDPRFRFVTTAYRVAAGGGRVTPVGRVAVEFRPNVSPAAIEQLARTLGLTLERAPRPIVGSSTHWFRVAAQADALAVAARLYTDPLVAWAHPDMLSDVRLESVPSDPFYPDQYYLKNSNTLNGVPVDDNVELAWNLSNGGGVPSAGGLGVAIIDAGIDATQPDLNGKVACGYDLFNEGLGCATSPFGNDSHGTMVAGVLAATQNNGQGITGVAPGAWLRPVRIFRGDQGVTDCQIAAGVDFAWQSSAAVLSNSWGYRDPNYPGNDCVTNAIARANTQGRNGLGSVVVFSAGNTSNRSGGVIGRVAYPARLPTVIAVGAIDRAGALTDYTPEGSELDIVAPSGHFTDRCVGDVVTTDLVGQPGCSDYPNNVDYTNTFSGTSAAAPQVSGVAALLISKEPTLTSDEVKSRIYLGADAWGPATQFGAGKLDALFALAPLGASITGPPTIETPGTYTWDSNPRGGSGSYSYVWRYRPINSFTWTQVGTGRTYSRTISQTQINFWLQVTVTSMWRTTTSPVFVVQNNMPGCHPRC